MSSWEKGCNWERGCWHHCILERFSSYPDSFTWGKSEYRTSLEERLESVNDKKNEIINKNIKDRAFPLHTLAGHAGVGGVFPGVTGQSPAALPSALCLFPLWPVVPFGLSLVALACLLLGEDWTVAVIFCLVVFFFQFVFFRGRFVMRTYLWIMVLIHVWTGRKY